MSTTSDDYFLELLEELLELLSPVLDWLGEVLSAAKRSALLGLGGGSDGLVSGATIGGSLSACEVKAVPDGSGVFASASACACLRSSSVGNFRQAVTSAPLKRSAPVGKTRWTVFLSVSTSNLVPSGATLVVTGIYWSS